MCAAMRLSVHWSVASLSFLVAVFDDRPEDTAAGYHNEKQVGECVRAFVETASNVARSDLFVTTKLCTCTHSNIVDPCSHT